MNLLNDESISPQKIIILLASLLALAGSVAIAAVILFPRPKVIEAPSANSSTVTGSLGTSNKTPSITSNAERSATKDTNETIVSSINEGGSAHPSSADQQDTQKQHSSVNNELAENLNQEVNSSSNVNTDSALSTSTADIETQPESQERRDTYGTVPERTQEAEPESPPTMESDQQPQQAVDPTTDSEPNTAHAFPSHWAGSYLGNTLDTEGNSIPAERMVWFDLSENNGQITGTCSVGMDDGSATVDGTFTVTGTYDHDTREITINGSEWLNQGDLWGMRNFWGTVSSDDSAMSGRCIGLNSGKEGDWSAYSD